MSLKATGVFTSLISAGTESIGTFRDAGEALRGFSKEIITATICSTDYDDALKIAALRAAGLTNEEIALAMSTTASGTPAKGALLVSKDLVLLLRLPQSQLQYFLPQIPLVG